MKGYKILKTIEKNWGELSICASCRAEFGMHGDCIRFHWICNPQKDAEWHSISIKVESYEPATYRLVARLLDDMLKKRGALAGITPMDIIEYLKNKKFVQVAYHEGLDEYIRLDRWPEGNTYKAKQPGYNHYAATVVATSEDEAIVAIRKKAAMAIERGDWWYERWLPWLESPTCEKTHFAVLHPRPDDISIEQADDQADDQDQKEAV